MNCLSYHQTSDLLDLCLCSFHHVADSLSFPVRPIWKTYASLLFSAIFRMTLFLLLPLLPFVSNPVFLWMTEWLMVFVWLRCINQCERGVGGGGGWRLSVIRQVWTRRRLHINQREQPLESLKYSLNHSVHIENTHTHTHTHTHKGSIELWVKLLFRRVFLFLQTALIDLVTSGSQSKCVCVCVCLGTPLCLLQS